MRYIFSQTSQDATKFQNGSYFTKVSYTGRVYGYGAATYVMLSFFFFQRLYYGRLFIFSKSV